MRPHAKELEGYCIVREVSANRSALRTNDKYRVYEWMEGGNAMKTWTHQSRGTLTSSNLINFQRSGIFSSPRIIQRNHHLGIEECIKDPEPTCNYRSIE
ncbi:hypothetical protein EYR41_010443 [Orbilia oligospora]|uniref:Uncharacterized protein n=1 Tax=Orbilia oligospora TaxID=2813651 RepID=A0A8H2HP00_ORBOL|nr:hypothetical protein EYR41_010443 [Orbilia oligospora]